METGAILEVGTVLEVVFDVIVPLVIVAFWLFAALRFLIPFFKMANSQKPKELKHTIVTTRKSDSEDYEDGISEHVQTGIRDNKEDDWLAKELQREKMPVSASEDARRLRTEHNLDCDARNLKSEHVENHYKY